MQDQSMMQELPGQLPERNVSDGNKLLRDFYASYWKAARQVAQVPTYA